MRKIFTLLSVFSLLVFSEVKAQVSCIVTVTPMDTTICPGDSVLVQASANILGAGQAYDFNIGTVPGGWGTTGGTAFTAPCGPNPTNTPYYWASTSTSGNPGISTGAFDISCGGVISFDMVYAIQSGAAPCEGPDEQDEGVSLQYSLDGGLTWTTIIYYSPGGFTLPANPFVGGGVLPPGNITPYTSWGSFTVPIPTAALSTGTMFQWVQESPTSGTCCDNWGLDNIIINATGPPCGSNTVVNWNNGMMDTTSYWVVPYADTAFVALVFDTAGNYQCQSDTVLINIYDGLFSYTLPNTTTVYCPDDSALVNVTNVTNALAPMAYNWSTGSTVSSTYLNANGVTPDTLMYYVDITDGCGFTIDDSVELIVNQTLNISSITSTDQFNCTSNGSATATIGGNIGPVAYYWTGPGNTGTYTSSSSTISNISTGWYYLTASDNVCQVSDSVFVDSLNVDNINYVLDDSIFVYCPGDSGFVEITNITGATNPITYTWSTGSTLNSSYLPSTGLNQETITYTVTFVDDCGYTRSDEVVLVVDKLLQVDSVTQRPTTTCNFDGEVNGYASGITGTPQYLWQEFIDFNNPGAGGSVANSTWSNTGTGWYYFTVTDDVCSDTDSIFLEMLDAPIADFNATPVNGCSGMSVTFSNNSQNTVDYFWDFGNGVTETTSSMTGFTQQYFQSTQVMLISSIDNIFPCSDTAYININVVECGCMDPEALNYNPLAVQSGETCIYPIPVVNAPNVFSPNGDGANEFFTFETQFTEQFELTVLNRWGGLMFESTYNTVNGLPIVITGWDGDTPNNTKAEEGTYFYKYIATGINGDVVEGQGFLQLVRN